MKLATKILALVISFASVCQAQLFYFGNDLSYVNQMEDCGTEFKDNGAPKDVYRIFADRGANLVTVRLWVDPSWWQSPLVQPAGVKSFYNDLEDVKETIRRSKAAGMQVMLGIHYSDFWADPGRQLIPRRWLGVAYNLEALKDSVYNYTASVLTSLNNDGLMPEFVKVGNETNNGILRHIPQENGYEPIATVSNSWSRHAQLFNAAIKAVRDVGATASINPKIVIHFAGLGQVGAFRNIMNNGVTDFDIVGISYYYAWHGGSISQLQSAIRSLVTAFPGYEAMVIETGYPWTTRNFDQLGNIVTEPDPEYLPVIPEKQLEYLVDYARAVMKGGGAGVVFWEPAWVSTPCRTPWGIGSSHDHLVYFDPVNDNFMENGGGRWMERDFYQDPNAHKLTFKVDMSGQDVSNGVYITGSFTGESWQLIRMVDEGANIYSYYTYLPAGSAGGYYVLNGNDWAARETVPAECAKWGNSDRGYEVPDRDVVFALKWGLCIPDEVGGETEIDLENPSFEEPGIGETNWDYIPGWSLDAPAIDSGVATNSVATDGAFVAWLDSDDGVLWQLTDYTIQEGDVLTLKADVRNSWQTTTFDLMLYFDNNGTRVPVATTTGNFNGVVGSSLTEFTVTFSTASAPQAVGRPLGIAIRNTSVPNSFIEMDNFRLIKTGVTSVTKKENQPNVFVLEQSYPNPFNPETTISYQLPQQVDVRIEVYNMLGQYVATLVDTQQVSGQHSVQWNGKDFRALQSPSGIYFVEMVAGSFKEVKRMTLLR